LSRRRDATGRGINEASFIVEEAPERGYTARAPGEAIFTETDDLDGLRASKCVDAKPDPGARGRDASMKDLTPQPRFAPSDTESCQTDQRQSF
jgi:hypothetical protein